jgi:hypothetical protein
MAPRTCTREKSTKKCSCTYEPCSRKGFCCECIQYHWVASRELPACFFTADSERTYDRSLEHFLAVWNKKPGNK